MTVSPGANRGEKSAQRFQTWRRILSRCGPSSLLAVRVPGAHYAFRSLPAENSSLLSRRPGQENHQSKRVFDGGVAVRCANKDKIKKELGLASDFKRRDRRVSRSSELLFAPWSWPSPYSCSTHVQIEDFQAQLKVPAVHEPSSAKTWLSKLDLKIIIRFHISFSLMLPCFLCPPAYSFCSNRCNTCFLALRRFTKNSKRRYWALYIILWVSAAFCPSA
jgi:hypothetical protein